MTIACSKTLRGLSPMFDACCMRLEITQRSAPKGRRSVKKPKETYLAPEERKASPI